MKRIVLIMGVLLLFAACTPDPSEQFIQGKWTFASEGATAPDGSIQWQFSNKKFFRWQENTGDAPIASQGNYRIIESNEEMISLELYNIEGDIFTYNNSSIDIQIELDKGNNTLRISRMLFIRVTP